MVLDSQGVHSLAGPHYPLTSSGVVRLTERELRQLERSAELQEGCPYEREALKVSRPQILRQVRCVYRRSGGVVRQNVSDGN